MYPREIKSYAHKTHTHMFTEALLVNPSWKQCPSAGKHKLAHPYNGIIAQQSKGTNHWYLELMDKSEKHDAKTKKPDTEESRLYGTPFMWLLTKLHRDRKQVSGYQELGVGMGVEWGVDHMWDFLEGDRNQLWWWLHLPKLTELSTKMGEFFTGCKLYLYERKGWGRYQINWEKVTPW